MTQNLQAARHPSQSSLLPQCNQAGTSARPEMPSATSSPLRHGSMSNSYHYVPPKPRVWLATRDYLAESDFIYEHPESCRYGHFCRNSRPERAQKPAATPSIMPRAIPTAPRTIVEHRQGIAFEQEMARIRSRLFYIQSNARQCNVLEHNVLAQSLP